MPAGTTAKEEFAQERTAAEPIVDVTYYTDPLCSWSWAFEPQWRRLRYEFGGFISWRYRMGGLIPDWQHYNDPLNSVGSPSQMGPHWFQTRHLSGMPIEDRIWYEDPPASSYPACIAVKAAERQGSAALEAYLRGLREAVMLDRRNIARPENLTAIARGISTANPALGFDPDQFARDLDDPATLDAFREDLKDVRYRDIGRFPTLILRHLDGSAVIVVGYRPYHALLAALGSVAPDLAPIRPIEDLEEYAAYWGGRVMNRELQEATAPLDGMDPQRT